VAHAVEQSPEFKAQAHEKKNKRKLQIQMDFLDIAPYFGI
jgi:hypothetical protein